MCPEMLTAYTHTNHAQAKETYAHAKETYAHAKEAPLHIHIQALECGVTRPLYTPEDL